MCAGICKRPFLSCQVPCDCDCCLNKRRNIASFSQYCAVNDQSMAPSAPFSGVIKYVVALTDVLISGACQRPTFGPALYTHLLPLLSPSYLRLCPRSITIVSTVQHSYTKGRDRSSPGGSFPKKPGFFNQISLTLHNIFISQRDSLV